MLYMTFMVKTSGSHRNIFCYCSFRDCYFVDYDHGRCFACYINFYLLKSSLLYHLYALRSIVYKPVFQAMQKLKKKNTYICNRVISVNYILCVKLNVHVNISIRNRRI